MIIVKQWEIYTMESDKPRPELCLSLFPNCMSVSKLFNLSKIQFLIAKVDREQDLPHKVTSVIKRNDKELSRIVLMLTSIISCSSQQ
jgi:hypothetical protein